MDHKIKHKKCLTDRRFPCCTGMQDSLFFKKSKQVLNSRSLPVVGKKFSDWGQVRYCQCKANLILEDLNESGGHLRP